MAERMTNEEHEVKQDRNVAYQVRKLGKLIRVLLNTLSVYIGDEQVKKLEKESGVDLDGDGKVGSGRTQFVVSMAMIVIALAAWAATTVIDNKPGPEGARMRYSDVSGVGTLEVCGGEGDNAELILDADEGDDNADTWTIRSAASGNALAILNHASSLLSLDTSGNLSVVGTLTGVGSSSVSNLTVSGTLGVTGAATLSSTLGVTGAATLSGGAAIKGSSTLTNTLTGQGTAIITNVVLRGSSIGAVNPSTGAFTTLSASGATTLSGGAAIAGASTLTNSVTGYAGAVITNVALHGSTIGAVNPTTGVFTETTVDGKYSAVGPDATTGLMISHGSFTNGQATVAFTTTFGAAPSVVCGWTSDLSGIDLHGTNTSISATSVTTSNFVPTISSLVAPGTYTNCNYIAVGTRP